MCWYCHWGWPKPVADIYLEAVDRLYGNEWPLHWSASHIVWEDCNFNSAQWCLDHFDEYRGDYSDSELRVVRWSLMKLARLPVESYEIYFPEGANFDDYDSYPPPEGMELVKI